MWNYNICPQVQATNDPVFFTLNEFTERSLTAFTKCVHKADSFQQPVFPIIIQSDGGRADILFGFMSLMEEFRGKGMKFAAVVAGTASSAGCCVFLFADFRYMGKFSSLLLHSVQIDANGPLPNMQNMLKWNTVENDRLFETLSRNMKKGKDWIKNQLKKNHVDDWLISAEEALKNGMATEIRIPTFNLAIRSEFSIS